MAQATFAHSPPANDARELFRSLSIFADRPHVRAEMRDDADAAGFQVCEANEVASLLAGDEPRPLGDVVLIDCPLIDGGGTLAALSRVDLRAAQSGAQLVVSTSVAALDDVFACLDQSRPQILVEPTRAERVMALGRALAEMSNLRVRELAEEDRLVLLRLTEQIGRLAERLEGLPGGNAGATDAPSRLASPRPGFAAAAEGGERLTPSTRPAWPDPRLVRRVIRQRQLRARVFGADLFADPAWDILLDLTAARGEGKRVSVTSLCIASGVPPTTALRWIGHMTELGLLQRIDDATDRRRAFIALTDKAAEGMARYFAELGHEAALAA